MSDCNLASIEKILDIKDIEGADFIQLAFILGFQSVIKKGEYRVGDYVVFIQPDTLLPRREWNKFLWPKDDQNPDGNPIRLRSARFKSALSQGLVINCLNLHADCAIEEGKDVSIELGIQKYEKPLPANLSGQAVGYLPWGIPKTDETNLRNKIGFLAEIFGEQVIISMKMDGSSSLFAFNNGDFAVCSRQINTKESDDNAFWQIARQYNLREKMAGLGRNLAINGELCGPKLNGNKLNLNKLEFFAYNLFDIDGRKYLGHDDFIAVCRGLSLPTVPVIFEGDFRYSFNELVEMSDKLNYNENPNFPAEGIVVRTRNEMYSNILKGRASAKLISQRFLAKYKE